MRIAAFIISICLFVLAGIKPAAATVAGTFRAATQSPLAISASASYQQEEAILSSIPDQDLTSYQVSDWVEDEDNLDFFAKKFKLIPGTYAVLSSSAYLNLTVASTSGPAPPSHSARITYKYILQRVLRV